MDILIGSRALEAANIGFRCREGADWDIISNEKFESPNIEVHDPKILLNEELQFFVDDVVTIEGRVVGVLGLQGLAIVKRSHLWRDLSFDKHITMYHRWLKPYLPTEGYAYDYLKRRTEETHKMFPQGNPNLMQSKEDFFNDAVTKKYDHDYLHELFAYYDKPLYTRLLRQAGLAWCDRDKWDSLSHEDKILCVAEETQVIAAERFCIPNEWRYNTKRAYFAALKKVCTTLTSGWFRCFAIDYYPEIISRYDPLKFDHVRKVLQND